MAAASIRTAAGQPLSPTQVRRHLERRDLAYSIFLLLILSASRCLRGAVVTKYYLNKLGNII